nr:MAG TPA: hypothetical protein [Caudoviricetes sp.]
MKNVYDRVGSTLDDTKGARPSRNTSPIGREHEPFIRAAGSSPGVPIGFERSYPQLHIFFCKRPVEIWGVL